MFITYDYMKKINKHANIIALITPILILCNVIQPSYNKEVFLNLSSIFLFSTLLLIITFKVFMFSLSKYNMSGYIDVNDTLEWAIMSVYMNLIPGVIFMIIHFMIKIYHPAFLLTYMVIFTMMYDFIRQLLSLKLYSELDEVIIYKNKMKLD